MDVFEMLLLGGGTFWAFLFAVIQLLLPFLPDVISTQAMWPADETDEHYGLACPTIAKLRNTGKYPDAQWLFGICRPPEDR